MYFVKDLESLKAENTSVYKNIFYSISANILNFFISLVSTLFIPRVLSIEHFGYWQLYMFYVGYIGFFYFGLGDGVYLRYGGKYYNELDKGLISSQFWLLVWLEILICFGLLFVSFCIKDISKRIVVICFGINCIIVLPRAVLLLLLQCTGLVKEYAKNFIIERLAFFILVIGILLLKVDRFEYLIVADVFAKIIALLGMMVLCKDIVFSKQAKLRVALLEFWQNITAGIMLLFANIAGMLIIGIVRFGIERNWDIATFGKVSFSLSISSFILTFISAVGVVIFPIIKRSDQNKLPKTYESLGMLLSAVLVVLLVAYYPIQKLLMLWLPQYEEAIRYFAILFPISIFESRTALLNNTYLKALREEKAMLLLNGITVVVSLISTVVIINVFSSLPLVLLSIVGLQILKCILPEYYLQKRMGMERSYDILWSIAATCIFIYGNWTIGGLLGWGIYVVFVILMIGVNFKKYCEQIRFGKTILEVA